jgi:hypothetical protein
MNRFQFYLGLILALLAALIVLFGSSQLTTGAAIAIGILGIGLIATARRRD